MDVRQLVIIGVGLILGWLLPIIWERVSPTQSARQFWRSLYQLTRNLVADLDSDDFIGNYGQLLKLSGAYAGRNLLALSLAIIPVLAFWVLVFTHGTSWLQEDSARYLEINPYQNAVLVVDGKPFHFSQDSHQIPFVFSADSAGSLEIQADVFELDNLTRNHAFCRSSLQCLLFLSLNFEVTALDPEKIGGYSYIVVRPSRGDDNYLWPFLSDEEFYFLIALTLASVAGFIRRSSKH